MSVTKQELKRRHEAGEKMQKRLLKQIDAELKRVCAYRECDKSLAWQNSRARFCSSSHGVKEKTRIRAANRAKKRRYYEKHGITFNKTIRNRITKPGRKSRGVEYTDQILVYEDYKEPLKKIEKGYGYYGTIAMTKDGEYIQCHICGNLFPNVGVHLRRHKITSAAYKEKFGLAQGTGLVSEPERERMQKNIFAKKTNKGELPVWLKEYNKKVQSGEIKHKGAKAKHGGLPLEKRNKLGICAEQILDKITDLKDKLGHTPSYDEFVAEYNGKYISTLKYFHGSYLNAVKKAGLISAKELKEPDNEVLIGNLIDFHERHGRTPMTSDFNRGLLGYNRQMFTRRFGSLNNARVEAGLNAILPLPFGKIVEMTPDEYRKYKEDRSGKQEVKSSQT